jgi:hypothetical protein
LYEQECDGGLVEPVENEHHGPRQQRRIELEGGVLRSCADERDSAVLHVRQERILLGTVEAVDLVDEQQRALADVAARPRPVEGFAQILHAGEDGRKLLELELGLAGEQPCEGGLAGPRRPPEDHADKLAAPEHAREGTARPQQVVLPDHIRKPLGAKAIGKRARRALFQTSSFEQIAHAATQARSARAGQRRRVLFRAGSVTGAGRRAASSRLIRGLEPPIAPPAPRA